MSLVDDPCRRWTRELTMLRSRASRAGLENDADSRLGGVLRDVLALCENLLQEIGAASIECNRIQALARAAEEDWVELFNRMPHPCVCTDGRGYILRANPAAAEVLAITPRHLDSRLLIHFAEDREQFARVLRAALLDDQAVEATMTIRPRDRAPVAVEMRAVRRAPSDLTLLWFFQRQRSPQPVGVSTTRPSNR